MALCACLHLHPERVKAQSLLDKKVSLVADDLPLGRLLREAGRQAGFSFSYPSDAIPEDSLVTISVNRTSIRELLDMVLLRELEYVETGNYLILRIPGRALSLTVQDIRERRSAYLVRGLVTDPASGMGLPDASVYEKQLLLAALTGDSGEFLLRVKDRYKTVSLTVSKAGYRDTSMVIQLEGVTVLPGGKGYSGQRTGRRQRKRNGEAGSDGVERTGLGRFLVSSRQRIQSLNLRGFFTESPVQVSLTPGLSTQGRMSAQIVNKFSVNLIGGYTAGVEGMEMGGIFNMNKKDVGPVQLAGGFNIVGGTARGVQAAGVHNLVLDSLRGVQIGGAYNRVRGAVHGVQISGVVNTAGVLKGVQVGIINVADSSSGYSIGLVNMIRKNGYRRLSVFTSESFLANLSFQSGTSKLYTILQGGITTGPRKLYGYGAGFGREISLRPGWFVQPELLFQEVYQGNRTFNNQLYRLNVRLHYRLGKSVHFFAGPSFSVWNSNQPTPVEGYGFLSSGHGNFDLGSRLQGWIGWSAGVSLF